MKRPKRVASAVVCLLGGIAVTRPAVDSTGECSPDPPRAFTLAIGVHRCFGPWFTWRLASLCFGPWLPFRSNTPPLSLGLFLVYRVAGRAGFDSFLRQP